MKPKRKGQRTETESKRKRERDRGREIERERETQTQKSLGPALRVFRAETRLTVYRPLYITKHIRLPAPWPSDYR